MPANHRNHGIDTDPEALRRRADEVIQLNMGFRAWALKQGETSAAELDTLAATVAAEVSSQVDCCACGACCRVLYSVAVDGADVTRLAAGLGLSEETICSRYIRLVDGATHLRARPCPFLRGSVCSIYEHRPRACRDFPYLYTPDLRGRLLGLVADTFLCPIVFRTLEELRRRLPWRRKRTPRSA